jgi:hypothetical protein
VTVSSAPARPLRRSSPTVDDDTARAREPLSDALGQLYPHAGRNDLVSTAVWGPPADCVRGLREVAEAGAELIHLNPLFDDAEQMERLAAEVIFELSTTPAAGQA